MSKLTKAQRGRLEKLAAYLEGLPANYHHFGMARWLAGATKAAEIAYALKNGGVPSCGTSACAAGHGPAAGILVPRRFVVHDGVQWVRYCSLFVGPSQMRRRWCFGGTWDELDDHHYGAAARMRYLLDKGEIPAEYEWPTRSILALYAPYRIDARDRDGAEGGDANAAPVPQDRHVRAEGIAQPGPVL